MAYLVADASGDFLTAATWKVADATSLSDSQTSSATLTTTFQSSTAFTPGAITIQGLCVKVASISTAGNPTFTVRLAVGGVAVAGTTVTINATDLPVAPTGVAGSYRGCTIGWVYLAFSAPVTLLAATAYTLQASATITNRISLYVASGANWSRLLVTTTTAAPAAGDSFTNVARRTGAGASTTFSVRYDDPNPTDYGSANTIVASASVGQGCELTFSTTSSTTLRLSGILQVWAGGIFRMGSASTPIPRAYRAILEFDSAADGDFGYVCYGTHSFYGESRTSGKTKIRTRLTADLAAAGTTLTVLDDTGWLNGDRVLIGATTRVATETEIRTLSADAGASSLTVTAGATNAHSGTTGSQAEIALIDRNVVVRAVTTTATYFWIDGSPADDPDMGWVLWENSGGTGTKQWSFGSASSPTVPCYSRLMQSCVWYGFEVEKTNGTAVATSTRIRYVDCISYGTGNGVYLTEFINVRLELQGGAFFGTAANAGVFRHGDGGLSVTDVLFCGGGVQARTTQTLLTWAFEDCEFHSQSSNSRAIFFAGADQGYLTVRRCRFWRGSPVGFGAAVVSMSFSSADAIEALFEDCQFIGNACAFGCGTGGLAVRGLIRFVNCDFNAESGYTASTGWTISTTMHVMIEAHECRFSQVSPVFSGSDIANNGTPWMVNDGGGFRFINTLFGAAIPLTSQIRPIADGGSGVYKRTACLAYMREGGISQAHETQFGNGFVLYQSALSNVAAPCEELQPRGASTLWPLRSSRVFKPVPSGSSVTFTVYVRKSAAYDGAQPRVRVLANGSSEWQDTESTMAGVADVWEQLQVTVGPAAEDGVAEAFVECDGTAGSVYVDDWSATVA